MGLETLEPASSADALLLLEVLLHLIEIVLDQFMRGLVLESAKSRQRCTSTLPVSTAGEPSGRFGDEEDTDSKGERKGHAKANDNTPGGVLLLNVSHTVVDNVGDEDTKGNHELVTSWVLVVSRW